MTRDEAISVLYMVEAHGLADEAKRIAIEALSREQKKYDAICDELRELKNDLNLPLEVAMAYENSIAVVKKYARMGVSK